MLTSTKITGSKQKEFRNPEDLKRGKLYKIQGVRPYWPIWPAPNKGVMRGYLQSGDVFLFIEHSGHTLRVMVKDFFGYLHVKGDGAIFTEVNDEIDL